LRGHGADRTGAEKQRRRLDSIETNGRGNERKRNVGLGDGKDPLGLETYREETAKKSKALNRFDKATH